MSATTGTVGAQAEQLALQWLRRRRLRLLARNFRTRQGEIDLIMQERGWLKGEVLVFVEVRYRRHTSHGGAAASVTPTKQQRIIRAAHQFRQSAMHAQPHIVTWPARFDVVCVTGSLTKPHITWLRHAFEC